VAFLSPYQLAGQPRVMPGDSALNWYSSCMARARAKYGTHLTLVAPGGGDAKSWEDDGVTVLPSFERNSAFSVFQITVALLKRSEKIVHVQHELRAYGGIISAFALPFVMQLCRMLGKKVITTFHGLPSTAHITEEFVRHNGLRASLKVVKAGLKTLGWMIISSSDAIIVHQHSQVGTLQNEYGASRAKIHVIPIGVSDATADPSFLLCRARLGIPSSATVLMFFGFLSPYKGLNILLPAVARWLSGGQDRHFLLCGERPKRYAIHNKPSTLSIRSPRFHVTGFVSESDVATYFGAADALVLPYTINMSASGPLNLALGFGLPILISNVFEQDYALRSTFAPTSEALFETMENFSRDPAYRERAKRESNTLKIERSWDKVAAQTVGVYRSTLAHGQPLAGKRAHTKS